MIVSFGEEWSIDGEPLTSFAGGLRDRQVTTRHDGRSHGIHVDLVPAAAHRIFRLLDAVFASRLEDAPPRSPEVDWAWQSLIESGGNLRVTRIATGSAGAANDWPHASLRRWRAAENRRPIAGFECARTLAEAPHPPDWARVAAACGFYDQSHLINEFRAFTGRTSETFFQDSFAAAA